MKEFKSGELKSSSGKKVTNPKQAVAIALSEAGLSKNKKSTGGYMKKYGIDKVRGGSFKGLKLNNEQIKELAKYGIYKLDKEEEFFDKLIKETQNEVNSEPLKIPIIQTNGTCYRCMKDGHSQDSCRESHDKNGVFLEGEKNLADNELDSFFEYRPQDNKIGDNIFR
jgi:hypothetical protein